MSDAADTMDVAVIGAGVVGCAIARVLALSGRSVVLVDRQPRPGLGVTSRSSGVVHSGLYYPPGSLKASACVRGNALLYAYCARRGVPVGKPGKLVVATSEAQLAALEALSDNARRAGAVGTRLLGAEAARALEPAVPAVAALFCPETGQVDAVALARALYDDAVRAGALPLLPCDVRGVAHDGEQFRLDTTRGELAVERVVNAAGLFSDEVSTLLGVPGHRIHPCRGDWFRLRTHTCFSHHVYPVRVAGSTGLGVHLTLTLDGGYRLGPDAIWVSAKDDLAGGEDKAEGFLMAARALLGPLEDASLTHDGAGIRPKLRAPGDVDERDFVLAEERPGLVNLLGIDSPGLTAALDLAERVRAIIG